jgi:hypothetical protein
MIWSTSTHLCASQKIANQVNTQGRKNENENENENENKNKNLFLYMFKIPVHVKYPDYGTSSSFPAGTQHMGLTSIKVHALMDTFPPKTFQKVPALCGRKPFYHYNTHFLRQGQP